MTKPEHQAFEYALELVGAALNEQDSDLPYTALNERVVAHEIYNRVRAVIALIRINNQENFEE